MSSAASPVNDIARVIRALDMAFMEHANAKDAAAVTEAFYAEDAQLLPPNAPMVRGKEAIRAFWEGMLPAGAGDLSLDTRDVYASGDLAYATGKYSVTIGGEKVDGKYAIVYRRQEDGGYKVVVDAFSADAA